MISCFILFFNSPIMYERELFNKMLVLLLMMMMMVNFSRELHLLGIDWLSHADGLLGLSLAITYFIVDNTSGEATNKMVFKSGKTHQ